MDTKLLAGSIAFAVLNGAAIAGAATHHTLVDLGTLGGRSAYAAAVSQGGRVVGCSETAGGDFHAFAWHGGAITDLGPGSDTRGDSCALAVNDQGAVAGRSSTGELVIWKDGALTRLGIRGAVGDMNESGVVVGARSTGASTRAFVYRDGVVTDLGDAAVPSEATAINERGQVVGSAGGHAFLYDGGALRDLGTLGGNNSVARGINSSGVVVGQTSNEFGQPAPFIHRGAGAMQALPGPAYSSALAISASGKVIGSGEGVFGYLIDGGGVTRLAELPAFASRGWRRVEPTDINDRGWIVGTAENAEGDLRAFLLLPGSAAKPYRPGAR
jgi:probable HAF family extracellular repeat protein